MASPSKPRVLAHVPSVRESRYSAASTAQAPAAASTAAGDSLPWDIFSPRTCEPDQESEGRRDLEPATDNFGRPRVRA